MTPYIMGLALVLLVGLGGLLSEGAEANKGISKNRPLAVKIPTKYSVKVSYHMPYIGLEEPVFCAEDMEAGLQYLSFYDGLNTFRYIKAGLGSKKETAFEITPVIDHKDCFAHPTMGYRTVMPDPSPFVPKNHQEEVDGILCDVWELVLNTLNETSQLVGDYTLYTDPATGLIVRYQFLGHNTLFGGSHSDEYKVDYRDWVIGDDVDESVFTLPEKYDVEECIANSAKPEDGLMTGRKPWRNPRDDLVSMFPENLEQRVAAFDEYKETYSKEYADKHEHNKRHLEFHWNLRYIHSVNRQGLSYWLGVNHLADWTREEMRVLSGLALGKPDENEDAKFANYTHVPTLAIDQMPNDINWTALGAVTAVKDQGSCGSCWSFGTTGTIEGALFKKTGNLVRLSEQELMDCSWKFNNRACNGGEDGRSYRWMLNTTNGHISTEESYGPYMNAASWCHFERAKPGAQIDGYVSIPEGDMLAFNDALINVGPLSVAIDATQPSLYFYKGGLYDDPKCGKTLDHIVLATGYVTVEGQKYTLVKNSWSTHWGQDGYILVTQKDNTCGLANQATYPLMADKQPKADDSRPIALTSEEKEESFRVNIKSAA